MKRRFICARRWSAADIVASNLNGNAMEKRIALSIGRRQLLGGVVCGIFTGFEALAYSFEPDLPKRGAQGVFPSGYNLTLKRKFDRATDCYTQGLWYELDSTTNRGVLYESGGRYGRSVLRKVDAQTGKVLQKLNLGAQYFAEGLALVNDRVYLLTWRERVCWAYDKKTFEQVDEFRYSGEGWGLAFDGKSLAMSDGSSRIRFLDPETFRQTKSIGVHYVDSTGSRRPVLYLNELEFVNREIWANVYQREYAVRIDPESGLVLGSALNFSNLVPKKFKSSSEYVLNGLAYDSANRELYVTGKCWPVVYVFSVEPKRENGESTSDV